MQLYQLVLEPGEGIMFKAFNMKAYVKATSLSFSNLHQANKIGS